MRQRLINLWNYSLNLSRASLVTERRFFSADQNLHLSYQELQEKISETNRLVQFEPALEKLAKTLRKSPCSAERNTQLVTVLHQLAIINQDSAFSKATQYLKEAVTINPNHQDSKTLLEDMQATANCKWLR